MYNTHKYAIKYLRNPFKSLIIADMYLFKDCFRIASEKSAAIYENGGLLYGKNIY